MVTNSGDPANHFFLLTKGRARFFYTTGAEEFFYIGLLSLDFGTNTIQRL